MDSEATLALDYRIVSASITEMNLTAQYSFQTSDLSDREQWHCAYVLLSNSHHQEFTARIETIGFRVSWSAMGC
jgi:hypothetical protein